MASSIEFKLFAPYNKEAAVIGSFSDWEAVAMEKENMNTSFGFVLSVGF